MADKPPCNHGKYFLTLVFASIFLISLGAISHDAFAMGPSGCNNEYDGPFTSFLITNGSQTFDAMANSDVTFNARTGVGYNITFVIHTPSASSQNNTLSGGVWYGHTAYWYNEGGCTDNIGPNQNVTVQENFPYNEYSDKGPLQAVQFNTHSTTPVNQIAFHVQWIAVPYAPRNLMANSTSSSQITLNWNTPASHGSSALTKYDIYRGTTPGGEGTTPVASVNASTLSYSDTGLIAGQTYYYTVTASNSDGTSPKSNEASATPKTNTKVIEFSSNTSFSGTVNASDTLIIDNGVTITSNGITNYGNVTNYGVISMSSGGTRVFDNHGLVLNMQNGQFSYGIINNYPSAIIVNQNTNQYQVGMLFSTNLNNYGNYTTYGGLQSYSATITNYATGVILSHNSAQLYSATLNNYGRIDNFGSDGLFFSGLYTNGTFNNYASLSIASDQGSESITNGAGGIFNNLAGSGITIPGRTGGYSKSLVNSGTFNNLGGIFDGNRIQNSGIFNNNGTISEVTTGDSGFPIARLTNSGTFNNNQAGSISNSGLFTKECGATYNNYGTFNGNPVFGHCTTNQVVTINPPSGYAGTQVTVTGNNFQPNQTIVITFDSSKVGYQVPVSTNPSTITSNSSGGFMATFLAPTSRITTHSVAPTDGTYSATSTFTETVSTVPDAPQNLDVTTVSSSQINLSWTAPANDGGSVITGYMIERSNDAGNTWSTVQSNTGSTVTTYNDTGLAQSTTYTYRVSAINSVGTSQPSNISSATTNDVPPPPPTGIVLNNVQSASGMVSSSNQMTLANFNAGTGNNKLLVVGISADNSDVNSVTFNGMSLIRKAGSFYNNDVEFWYLKNPTGTGDVVVTMNGQTSAVVGAYSFSGVNQTTPLPTSTTKHNTNPNSPNITITTKFANDWVLDLSSIYGGSTLGSPTCTQQWDANVPDAITGASSSKVVPTPGAVTCKWTASSGDLWDDAAIEIKASN